VFDPIQGKLPRLLSGDARGQGQPVAIVGATQVGGHQQDFVAQGLQRRSVKLRMQTQAFEPVDELVGQQEQMEVGLVGEEVAAGDAAQRVIALELFEDQLHRGPVIVKAPEVERLQRQIRDQDLIKELLSSRLADVEDTANWQGFLVDPKSRGLKGTALKLITVDGHPALLKALREVYPLRRLQRCIAHKLRNVVVKLKRAQREACMGEAKLIFGAPSRTEAIRRFRAWRTNRLDEAEAAVRCLEKDLFHCFHDYRFPQHLWKTIRTTNILERAFREVRRRTRPMRVFTNAESAERIMHGVTEHLNANWQEHPLRQIQPNA
jgi:putative transposase